MSAHKRRVDEGKAETTVSQPRGVRDEDITHQIDGIVADPVEGVTRRVTCSAGERGKDDDADDVHSKEEEPGLGTPPKVEGLRNRKLEHTTDDRTEDAGGADGRQHSLLSESNLG